MSNKRRYQTFCKTAVDLPIFLQDWYLDVVCVEGEWDVAIVEKAGRIIAAMPYYIKKKGFFTYSTIPPLTKWLGPYLLPELRKRKHELKLYKELIEQLPTVDFFNQNFHYTVKNWLPFYWQHFRQTTQYSYLLTEIDNLEQIYKNISTDYRNNKIKKAKEHIVVSSDRTLKDLYDVNKLSFERQGMSVPYSFSFLENLDKVLAEHKARKLFFATDQDGNIHSVLYLIWDKQSSYYHIAGDDPALRSSGASILLVWEAIQFTSKELGLKTFDFEGSMIEGIERVRRQFGAVQYPYFNVRKYYSKTFQVAESIKGMWS